PYLVTESQTVECKTSLGFPPDNNMQPNPSLQSANIFKGICGFLNSSIGGTLYIGVNDQGYVTGLSQDLRYLKCQTFDTFARVHIMDPLIKLFGKDVMTYVHIDPGFDGEVAIIKVEPFPFGVVEMNGISYVRVDRETRQMTDRVKAQITHEKLLKDRGKADNLLNLQQAKYNRCKAILHDYASSNGGTISNREVEVYEVFPEDGLAACFDCGSRSCKFFSIGRMKYVEITDKNWENQHSHRNMYIDSFRMSGEPRYSVSLQLDLHAKNLLVEQYPRTENDLSKDANDTNVWYYSAKVSGLDALARFYLGLADHIRILDAPELQEYISNYVSTHLSHSNEAV
ncbi:MAG: ATP-binding protein, partial [Muribaculaceae bacterium]|nr:ATP-binding protein [Muribaculaceae bacterium]